jgi:AcrR family transcriptional regulator
MTIDSFLVFIREWLIQIGCRACDMSKPSTSAAERIREKKKRFLDREQRIIDASLKLLLEKGVDNVTVSAIANAAGVGKGTVYKHFLTKTEILMSIVLNYEQNISSKLMAGVEASCRGDSGAIAKAYFRARLENPAVDRLVQQLERRLQEDPQVAPQMEELNALRLANIAALNKTTEKLIAKGVLEDVPPHYHYLASWALVKGAVEVYFNNSFAPLLDDKEQLLDFITNIGITMGNRGQLKLDS